MRFGITVGLTLSASWAAADPVETTFVAMGPGGQAVARVVTRATVCPTLIVNGAARRMTVRAPAATEPLRPTRSTQENSKPSAFPVLTCDAVIPPGTRRAQIAGHRLPVPHRKIRRIVVIGDTGCQLKASDKAWQACDDPAAYPFARIAAAAAAMKPDLVVHVGDYLYRENPCRAGDNGCAGSPWGYGWDAWQADFFAPGKRLLEAAPWVVVRGNHENCTRAGQGWWRLLDPRPLVRGRDCNDPAKDSGGDVSPAYSVPLGAGAQIVVMDLSAAGSKPIPPTDPRFAAYRATAAQLAQFSRHARFTFAADHYPFFGVAAESGTLEAGNPGLQQVFSDGRVPIIPKGVDVLLAGHIHTWQHEDFGGIEPSQFITGFSGTQEDAGPIPKVLPSGVSPAPDAPVRRFDAMTKQFGFMLLDRTGTRSWRGTVYSADGELLWRCRIQRRRSVCSLPR